jgi:integrase
MLRTKSGLPRYCSWNTDRHGTRRVRFRKGGFSTYLAGVPWSEEFMRQYGAALDGVQVQASNLGAARTIPGSFDALCVSYYRSPEFRGLKASTQTARRNIIERFRKEHGRKPIARLERAHIKDIIGAKAETPEAANNLLKMLRVLLDYAVSIDMLASNPAIGVKRYKSRPDGIHTWSEAEIAQFEAAYPVGMKERLALALAIYTGQRVSDVARMGWQHVKDGWIALRQQKTSTPLMIKMHPDLVQILASVPRSNLTFLVTDQGAPFSPAGLSNWFAKRCRAAGLIGCTAHGLRKAACKRLADAGCSVHEIAAISGHRSLKEIERYTREADQAKLAGQALERQLRAEREQELSNLETRLDKTGENG